MQLIDTTAQTGHGVDICLDAKNLSSKLNESAQQVIASRDNSDLNTPKEQKILHSDNTDERPGSKKNISTWDKFRLSFINGPDSFQKFRSHFTMGLNYVGIAFNSLAVVGKAHIPQ
jgi:hypothetical protein